MTVAQPWLELLQFIKSTWPRSNYITRTWQDVKEKLHERVAIMFQSSGFLYGSYNNFMSNELSEFRLEFPCLLAKMHWKDRYDWPTKKNLVSWIVIRT